MSHLTDAIERAMAKRGLTRYEVGKRTGWGPPYVSKVLNGNAYLGPKRLAALMAALDLSEEERLQWIAAKAADMGFYDGCACAICQLVRQYFPEEVLRSHIRWYRSAPHQRMAG